MNKNTTTKKNTTKKGTKTVSEEIIKTPTTEQVTAETPIAEQVTAETPIAEQVTAETEIVESSETISAIVDDIAPVFPPEEPVIEIPEPQIADTGVIVAKINEPVITPSHIIMKQEPAIVLPPLQNDISIMVQIKNENILIFKGYMKVSEIVKSLKNSEKSTVTVQNKIVVSQLVELAKLSNPERVIFKR